MRKTNVLIVEDDIVTAMDVEHELVGAGYDVRVAISETQALKLAEMHRPQLAVVDINLGPGDGRIVAKALHRNYKTAVLFASGECKEVAGLRDTGAMACLAKPFDPHAVVTALADVGRMADGLEVRLPPGVIALKP